MCKLQTLQVQPKSQVMKAGDFDRVFTVLDTNLKGGRFTLYNISKDVEFDSFGRCVSAPLFGTSWKVGDVVYVI